MRKLTKMAGVLFSALGIVVLGGFGIASAAADSCSTSGCVSHTLAGTPWG